MKLIAWACAFLCLAASVRAQTLVPGLVKHETWPAATIAQVITNGQVPTVSTNITYNLTSWDAGDVDLASSYADRLSSEVTVDTTGTYDFILSSDDNGVLYFAQDDNPTNKVLIAQQDGWSIAREWNNYRYFDAVVIGPVPGPQKNSATWTNSLGATPWAAGFTLNAGQRYYLEAIRGETGGEDHFAVTLVPHGTAPTDGDATTLTNALSTYGFTVTVGVVISTPTNLTFTLNPSNRTVYAGMSAYFTVSNTTDSIVATAYQWRRGGANIAGATTSTYSFVASTNDNSAQFDCVASVPGPLVKTSAVATLTVPVSGGLTVQGLLRRELFTTAATAGTNAVAVITNGNNSTPASVNTFQAFDLPSAGANYGERVNGFFTPATTGYYVFFIASDDNALLFVSTNDQPNGKRLVAQEDDYSDTRSWNTPGALSTSVSTQKRSDQWSPDSGATTPYAGGIHLDVGSRYYIEAVHRGGAGANGLAVTAVLTNDVAPGLPADGDASTLSNTVISYVTTPVGYFAISGPQNQTVFEGIGYAFTVAVTTSNFVSEITPAYQWTKWGSNFLGATGTSVSGVGALVDDQAPFACKITIPGVTNDATSSTGKLTVIQGVYFPGNLRQERWNNDTTVTRALVESGLNGTPADVVNTVNNLDLGNPNNPNGDHIIRKISGYFVPPVTTNYIFFFASDDDGDLFLSTNESPANKRWICQEQVWSNRREWLTSGGLSATSQKRSDQFVNPDTALPVDPEGDGIPLVAGQRYYIEAVSHENANNANVSATYKIYGQPDPVGTGAGTALLTANRIQILTAPSTVLTIITNVQTNVTSAAWEPAYFTTVATNNSTFATFYQWRRDNGSGTFTNIPANATTYGFICSTNDNGARFDCVVQSPGLIQTSLVATLTLQPGSTLVEGTFAQELWVGTAPGNVGAIQAGIGYANVRNAIGLDNAGRPPEAPGNFGRRAWGFFNPPATTNYVFFINTDDQGDLYVSMDDQPNHKMLAAQETGWSDARLWLAFGNLVTGGGGGSTAAQKRTDQWSPAPADFPPPAPWANGFPMVAGNRYYIEIQHRESGGGDDMGLTYKVLDPADPAAGDPANLDPSLLVGPLISHFVPARTLTVTPSPTNTLIVSWTLPGGTLQSTPSLTPTAWTAEAGTANPRILTNNGTSLFLRVSEP